MHSYIEGEPPHCLVTRGERPAESKDGCLILIPESDAHMAGEVVKMAQAAKVTLARTNMCKLEASWLKPFLAESGAEGGNDQTVKALSTGKAVGLEFGGDGCAEDLRGIAASAGLVFCANMDACAEYRYMGIVG